MSNKYRIINLIIFLMALFSLNFVLNGEIGIPTGEKALWFHSGLLLLVFGSYWIEYFFTRPSDVVINGLVAMVSISALENPPFPIWWNFIKWYGIALTISAFFIVWHGSPAVSGSKSGLSKRIFYKLVIRFGSAKVIFSLIFFLSIVSYYGLDSKESKWMLGFWTFVIILREMRLDDLFKTIISWFKNKEKETIGFVKQFKQPGIIKFTLNKDNVCTKDTIVAFSSNEKVEDSTPLGVVTVNRISPTDTECEAILIEKNINDSVVNTEFNVIKVDKDDDSLIERLSENMFYSRIKNFIGYSTKNTDIGKMKIDFTKVPDIEDGHLVMAFGKGSNEVLFQIVNGEHADDHSFENNERRFTLGTAQQVGTWVQDKQSFKPFSWVVKENSPVFHVTPDTKVDRVLQDGVEEIGQIPNSNYPAKIDLKELTLYHSAILGVTGSGKSFLAYHLIESLAKSGVKVLCLDVTGDYKRYLKGAVLIHPGLIESFLNSKESNIGIIEFHEKNAHPIQSTKKISDIAYSWCKKKRTDEDMTDPKARVQIVLEEAHTLVPEWNFNTQRNMQDTVNQISQIVLQARKYGLGFMLVTQRTANVVKSILSQCNTLFSFQAFDETGFDFLKNYMGTEFVKSLPNLKQRHGVLVGKSSLSTRPLIVRFHDQDRKLNDSFVEFKEE